MALLHSNGILVVSSIPTFTPTGIEATLARLEDTNTYYWWDGASWKTADLKLNTSYTGAILGDTDSLGDNLQALETAIEAITHDGTDYPLTRGDAVEDVEPTVGEIASPKSGDTAKILLTDGKVEYWSHNGAAWSKAFVVDHSDVTNLGYTASPTGGTVTSDTGTNSSLPLVGSVNAGLMTPAQKAKSDFITVTQAVDLDAVETAALSALQTVTDTNSVDLTTAGTDLKADVNISATQTGGSLAILADGLSLSVTADAEPPVYDSRTLAIAGVGVGARFQYSIGNTDGATEGSVAWT